MTELTPAERQRYTPHILLHSVGVEGQKKLKAARVLCVGSGGLGSPLLLYLAAAGVGTLGIVDNDQVEISNLQRQILFSTQDAGRSKTLAAAERLGDLNPHTRLVTHTERLTAENAAAILADYDLVADGSDNFQTRYLVNHTCLALKKTLISASVSDFQGQCAVFVPGGPCYQCLFPLNPAQESLPTCVDRGILGAVPGILGSVQAAEVLKLLLGLGETLSGRLLQLDILTWKQTIFQLRKDPGCPVCGPQKLPVFTYEAACSTGSVMSAEELKTQMKTDEVVLLDVRDDEERAVFHLGGLHLPLSRLKSESFRLPKDKLLAVYCQSGQRSLQAVKILQAQGFQSASLRGGIRAWKLEAEPPGGETQHEG